MGAGPGPGAGWVRPDLQSPGSPCPVTVGSGLGRRWPREQLPLSPTQLCPRATSCPGPGQPADTLPSPPMLPHLRLPLAGCQTLLSPIVSCGPPGVLLTRPVILAMDHCGEPSPESWSLRLKKQSCEGSWEVSPPPPGEPGPCPQSLASPGTAWALSRRIGPCPQDVLHLGEEAPSQLYYCQLEAGACYIFTEQLGRFALVGEALSVAAAKRLKLLLFAPAACTSLEYSIRVYCLHDTRDALKVLPRPQGLGVGGGSPCPQAR